MCGLPRTIDFGYLAAVTGVESGDTATYQCIPGFESAESRIITCQNGKWGSPPACYGKNLFVELKHILPTDEEHSYILNVHLPGAFSLKLLLRSWLHGLRTTSCSPFASFMIEDFY